MLIKLFRSTVIGLLVAGLLLIFVPSIRVSSGLSSMDISALFQRQPLSYHTAVQKAAPAVVNIYNSRLSSSQDNIKINSLGSGVIMRDDGYILTNQHVIAHAERIIITLQNGKTYEAESVGSDQLTDLAVLKIPANHLPVIQINTYRPLHIGDVVLAIGNPYNLGQTVTQGIISATGRLGLSPYMRQNFLQTDASINRGNSGGALVNTLGELVGINTLSLSKSNEGENPEGIGFAIPVDLATKIMDKLIADGRIIRGYIGIEPAFSHQVGVLVSQVQAGGPADLAGIQSGDNIIAVNNRAVTSIVELMDQIADIAPETIIPVMISRDNILMTVLVKIIENPTLDD